MLDLARFVEEDDEEEEYLSDLRRNQKRAEWAKGKTRAPQPSENWDDDFLFGSVSAESLPLPPKSSDLQPSSSHKKPGSSQSINPNLPSRSFHHQSHSSYSRPSKPLNSRPSDSDSNLTLDPDVNSLTPRKRPTQPHPIIPPASDSPQTLLDSTRTTSPTTTCHPPIRPALSRPPASAPPSRGQSVKSQSPSQHTTVQRRVSPIDHSSLLKSTSPQHSSRSSTSASHRPWTPLKAISSQDSVPSISDLSSTGFRSPSSSLSMTDDGRWDWSHSSGDGSSARFRGAGSGNLSFNTETEFTEPDTELEWADTDHEHHPSSRATYSKFRSHQQPISRPHPFSSPLLSRPSSLAQPSHRRPPNQSLHLSESYNGPIPSEMELSGYRPQRNSLENADPHPPYAPAPPSFDSQATLTSSQASHSKTPYPNNHPALSPSAASSTSSIGNLKQHPSDRSSICSTTSYGNQYAYRRSILDSENHIPPHQVRTPSSGSAFSNRFGCYNSGSESYDAAASGTETDVASDHFAGDDSHTSIPSPSLSTTNHHRNTPTACQRSRKQALYSRPSYVNPSPGRPLAASVSSSTLNASEVDLNPPMSALSLTRAGEDEKLGKNQLRRRFRKKRPSTLLLNKNPVLSSEIESPPSVISRHLSATESVFTLDSAQPGDLAFAADSEDDARRSRTQHQPNLNTEPIQKLNLARMNLHSRTPTRPDASNHSTSNRRSPTTITRSHQTLDQTRPGKTLSPRGATSDESTGKRFQPRRPISFTTLFSRSSTSSHGSTLSRHPSSQNVAHQQPTKNRFSHRHSTSIDSNLQPFTSSPHSQTSNDSLLSRVRRLSSRPPSHKNEPSNGLIRKRFSIVGDTVSGMPCLKASPTKPLATPTKPSKGMSNRFSSASRSTRRQISQSESVVSDMTLSAPDYQGTVRARRPSSRSSHFSSSNAEDVKPRLTLARKFSMRSNNKSTVHQPDLCNSPTDNIDHGLTCTAPVQAIPRSQSRKTLASRPPKSNPALRAKAEANAQLLEYRINSEHSFHPKGLTNEVSATVSDLDPVSSPVAFRNPFTRNSSTPVSNSEPTSTQDLVLEHEPQVSNHIAHIGNMNAALARSNSMGELRIPSRITSQQGRLQTELNQVKEFARGIEELKSMRLTYRKMIRSTHRSRVDQNFATDESDANSTDSDQQKDPGPLPDREPTDENRLIKPNQVSPRALDRLYTIIQKIQEEYKEWWTCCNVLIDLGEGKTDPRAQFTPERMRSITSYSQQPSEKPTSPVLPETVVSPEVEPRSQKHFEILKSMFGPSGEPPRLTQDVEGNRLPDPSSQSTPVADEKKPISCQTPPMETAQQLEVGEKTPRSRPLVGVENTSQIPTTPSPSPRKASHHDQMPHNGSLSSIRISDWGESESSWSGIEFGKDDIKSAPVKQSTGEKEKPRLLAGEYSTHIHHRDRLANFDSSTARPRLSAGSRIGISGIKDFLRVLKARVNAEEKWPPRKKSIGVNNNPALTKSVVGMKGRSVSSNLHSSIKGLPGQTESTTNDDNEVERRSPAMSLKERNNESVDGEGTIHRDNMTESSSEEECWDELFGFQDNTSSSVVTGTTESLDLALPIGQQHQTKKQKNINGSNAMIGEGGRLALSSERMPQLLNYLSIVKEQCKECLVELKSQTV